MIELGESERPISVTGYNRVTSLSSAASIGTVPAGTSAVLLQAETQNVRIKQDGNNPTSTAGTLVTTTVPVLISGNIEGIKAIETAASAALTVTWLSN